MADTKVSAIIFWKTAAISENVSYKEVQKQNTSANPKTAGQEGKIIPEKNGHREKWTV